MQVVIKTTSNDFYTILFKSQTPLAHHPVPAACHAPTLEDAFCLARLSRVCINLLFGKFGASETTTTLEDNKLGMLCDAASCLLKRFSSASRLSSIALSSCMVCRFSDVPGGPILFMNIVASIRPLAIPTHERFDRFILRKPERVREPRGGCIALRCVCAQLHRVQVAPRCRCRQSVSFLSFVSHSARRAIRAIRLSSIRAASVSASARSVPRATCLTA